jgi:glycosyltransferase involved in cell wall biosynthesis
VGGVVFYGVEALHPDYARRLEDAGVWYSEVRKRSGIDVPSRLELARVLRRVKADVVVMHGGGTAWHWPMLRVMGVRSRMVLVEHGPESACSSAAGFLRHAVSIFCADAVIAVSERLAECLRLKFRVFLRNRPVYVVPNGIDTEFFAPGEAARAPGTLLMVGTLSASKDHATLIRAVAALAKPRCVELWLAGDGALRGQLETLAEELGIRKQIKFLGNLARTDLLRLYRQAAVFTFSTKGEGSPLALLEAMSCALPVVASDIPGVREVLGGGQRGLLAPPGDPMAMASAIERILGDEELARRMGTNAREYVENNHSATRMAARYWEVLNGL